MSVYIPVELQQQVRTHFADRCAYCHTAEALTVAIFEFEHIIPRSACGETIFENLCLACPTCNRYKANRQTAPDPVTDQIVALFHPHQPTVPKERGSLGLADGAYEPQGNIRASEQSAFLTPSGSVP